MALLFPKPQRRDRPNLIRGRARLREWELARDQFKRAEQRSDGTWSCFHREQPIPTWEEAVVDHFPFTKGARPDLLCDPTNFVISHAACNTSGNPHRKAFTRP